MPKMKTHKSVSNRLKLTGTGKLKHQRPGRRHLLTKKTSKRKRQLKNPGIVAASLAKMYKKMIGL